MPADLYARREREFQAAKSAAEVDQLQRRWSAEDRAREAAKDWRNREVVALRQEVRALKKRLSDNIKTINDNFEKQLPKAIVGIVHDIIEQRMCLRYTGVWDDRKTYAPGAAATDGGSIWVATGLTEKGERPGKGLHWKLIAKGEAKGVTCA